MGRWAELACVLCGLIIIMETRGGGAVGVGSYPSRCPSNAGGDHIRPGGPEADQAKELHRAWLRDPFNAPQRAGESGG